MSACKHRVSGSISLPSRGSFHLSLTVLLHYRSSGSILAWRVVPPASQRIPRARWYSGYSLYCRVFVYGILTLYDLPSHAIPLTLSSIMLSSTPEILLSPVWPLSRSLAATWKISFDFSSSAYLDVSVQRVSLRTTMDSLHGDWVLPRRVPPFGNLRINTYLRFPVAYRSLSRPSSAPNAKASALCSY